MEKQYSNSNKRWSNVLPAYNDLLLEINERDAGRIEAVKVNKVYYLRLEIFEDSWDTLPVIAADLYQHQAGKIGFASVESALQSAAAVLEAHGWKEIK